ncbi:MAG: hypothetical protein WBA74_00725, partial [Cyclobacteriaceae bacterium]
HKIKYNQFLERSILEFEGDHLENKYPEYANLLNEYRDGILLFDIMEEEVWRKASRDTLGLSAYFETNKESYTKYQVKKATIYSTQNDKVLDQVEKMITDGMDRVEIMNTVNKNAPLLLQSVEGLYEKGENELVDEAANTSLYRTKSNEKLYLIHIQDSMDKVVPDLNTIKGKVISDYQNELEEEWLKELKAKYEVVVNNKTLKEVINEIENR